MKRTTTAIATAVALSMSIAGAAMASDTMLDPLTQTELDTNWQADRQFPSGGVTSVSAHGRDDVAEIGVVGDQRSTVSPFYYFEGIKKVGEFGTAVQVDLFVPTEWEDAGTSPLHVGFWSSDVDSAGDITAYPLVVFRNGDTVEAGFYVYDTTSGDYLASGVAVEYGAWNTLSIALDEATETVAYAVNGQAAGSSYAGGDTIGQVFLNHYNDGASDYTAHWHAGIEEVDSKAQCVDGGWEDAGFRNQGQCVRFVTTGKDSR